MLGAENDQLDFLHSRLLTEVRVVVLFAGAVMLTLGAVVCLVCTKKTRLHAGFWMQSRLIKIRSN